MEVVRIPKRWIDVSDELARSGFELTVIGEGRPVKGTNITVDLESLTITIRVPAEAGSLHFSREAVDALALKVADLLKAAAERAKEARRGDITATDMSA
jgi:hypothetical protein